MGIISGIKKILKNPYYIIPILNHFKILNWMPDEMFIKLYYRSTLGRRINLKNPQRFSEKLQWLKLNDRKPEYTRMVDKYESREYIAQQAGRDYLIPLLGVWERVDDIDFSTLPKQFVLKCTGDSGGVIIVHDKTSLNILQTKKKLRKFMKRNYYLKSREYPYKNVKPRIICEKYMEDESGTELKDYKVFCLGGKPVYILVDFNRYSDHKRNIYDTDWNYVPFMMNSIYPDPSIEFSKPKPIDEMLKLAGKLSKDHLFLRVDFYVIDEKLYIGELTFYPNGGFLEFDPPAYDEILGKMIKLPFEN